MELYNRDTYSATGLGKAFQEKKKVKLTLICEDLNEESGNQIVLGHLHLLTFIKGRDVLDL